MATALTAYLLTPETMRLVTTFEFFINEMLRNIPLYMHVQKITDESNSTTLLRSKIFEAEQANLYFETVISVKTFATCLNTCIFELQGLNELSAISQELLQSLMEQITNMANLAGKILLDSISLHLEGEKSVGWIGGWSFHGDVFLYIYNSLTLFIEISNAVEDVADRNHMQTSLDVNVLTKIKEICDISQIKLHPWIEDCIGRCLKYK